MKNSATKRAFLLSVLSLMLCISMLIGTTYAWFTDSVTTGVNSIKSGTLDIDVVAADGTTSLSGKTLTFQKAAGHENETVLWEPGASYNLESFYIVNKGDLYLKYKVDVAAATGDTELLDVIDFTIGGTAMDSYFATTDIILAPNEMSPLITIKGTMDTEAGNDYMGLTLNEVAITVYAAQVNKEVDSIDSTYDINAEYGNAPYTPPTVTVSTAAELQAALTPSISSDTATVSLAEDITLADGEIWTPLDLIAYAPNSVKHIIINGNGHTISGLNAPLLGDCHFGNTSIEIKDLTLIDVEISEKSYNSGSAAFIAYANRCASVTMSNCHLQDSNISVSADLSGVGGLIGYADPDVLKINGCSVTNTTINASAASAGAIVGAMGYYEAEITDAKVVGCTVTGERVDKTGYVIGSNLYCTNASITTKDCSGNTVFGTANSDVIYGRKVGTNPFTVNGVAK